MHMNLLLAAATTWPDVAIVAVSGACFVGFYWVLLR
jgi:hypothetical protein